MQRIKKELERAKEKESNHLKCCSGSIGGVIAKKKKKNKKGGFYPRGFALCHEHQHNLQ